MGEEEAGQAPEVSYTTTPQPLPPASSLLVCAHVTDAREKEALWGLHICWWGPQPIRKVPSLTICTALFDERCSIRDLTLLSQHLFLLVFVLVRRCYVCRILSEEETCILLSLKQALAKG